jgi:putative ABC transport system permease protein
VNVLQIAWRSIQHRGLGSLLTIISMALGVMMVVTVLAVHGLISKAFNDSNNFGYDVLIGARGGEIQLAFSSVYYLASPIENIPYEYYLAFCDEETRQRELKWSIANAVWQNETQTIGLASGLSDGLSDSFFDFAFNTQQSERIGLEREGLFDHYTHTAVPINLGDFWVSPTGDAFRCVGTKPKFFTEMLVSIDPEIPFEFSKGRCFEEYNSEHGYYEAVIGETVARKSGLGIGDTIQPTHGDPNAADSHIHETDFHIVGILKKTGTANDGALFLNMEGFFLMEGHAKSLEDDSVFGKAKTQRERREKEALEGPKAGDSEEDSDPSQDVSDPSQEVAGADAPSEPLQLEKREVTSILLRTYGGEDDDDVNVVGFILPPIINEGGLEATLDWSPFRPEKSQKAALAVNPVMTVTGLFTKFVDPIRWVLLALTLMICIVSAIGILVGIYNSMSQRRHEIAVIRALGASRQKVMGIMLCESILMAFIAGMLGWIGGHALTAALSPLIEDNTNVSVGFFDFAPKIPMAHFWGGQFLPEWLSSVAVSPEFLVVPGMMLLAIVVGIYPAISAYRTDVSKSLGK